MKKVVLPGSLALLLALFALFVSAGSVFAHGTRTVGPYSFVVGFLNEPAYVGQLNAVDLTICKGDCQYATDKEGTTTISNGVADADKTLKVELIMGSSAPLAVDLVANDEVHGKYTASFIPEKAGDYTFHISGTLENNSIDQKFTSSKDGFDPVGTVQQYPAITSNNTSGNGSSDVSALQGQVTTATTIAIVGIVLGIVGLALGGFALARKPRPAAVSAKEQTPIDSLRG